MSILVLYELKRNFCYFLSDEPPLYLCPSLADNGTRFENFFKMIYDEFTNIGYY